MIEPRTLKGFRDHIPEEQMPREYLIDRAREVFRSYGFPPIDTPALEYTEVLLAKKKDGEADEDSETLKIIYRFLDHGKRDIALRFDLTVPFARFAAQHIGKLGTPFKRYHMGPVWRGENTAQGRFREFWQCDFDIIGTTANPADIEIALVIHDLLTALGVKDFQIHLNNRLVLNGLLEKLGLAEKAAPVLRALDKLSKVTRLEVEQEMAEKAGLSREQIEHVMALAETRGTNAEVLDQLQRSVGDNDKGAEGIRRLRELLDVANAAGVHEDRLRLDVSIARGLDYYTGTIYETFLNELPQIGSICSGGRYDNLAGLYTKQALPGVGASLGLDRLVAAMEKLHLLPQPGAPAPVLLVHFSADRLGDYHRMGRALRAAGIGVEVYPEPKKIGQQFQYAEKRGFKVALIAGPDEFAKGVWKIKDLARREEIAVAESDVAAVIRRMVGNP